jgi:hypothetical protein
MIAMASPADVRRFAAQVAALIAAEHARDPMGELWVWLHMALRREASVGEMYDMANLDRRLADVRGPHGIAGLLRATIASIWAQEKAHAAYLEAMMTALAPPQATAWRRMTARLDGIIGAIEGQVMAGMTSPSQVQRAKASVMLAVGRHMQDVPGFVAALSMLSFREYCLLNAELETTAVRGYDRMMVLLGEIGPAAGLPPTLRVDIAGITRDERFHNEAFHAIAAWFDPPRTSHLESTTGNSIRPGLTLAACAAPISAIGERVYGDPTRADRGAGIAEASSRAADGDRPATPRSSA